MQYNNNSQMTLREKASRKDLQTQQGNLVCYSPWGHKESGHDLQTEQQQKQRGREAGVR